MSTTTCQRTSNKRVLKSDIVLTVTSQEPRQKQYNSNNARSAEKAEEEEEETDKSPEGKKQKFINEEAAAQNFIAGNDRYMCTLSKDRLLVMCFDPEIVRRPDLFKFEKYNLENPLLGAIFGPDGDSLRGG